jgi:hypothetical protein
LSAIGIIEYGLEEPLPFWHRATAEVVGNETLVTIDHRIFGPNDEDAYYFTSIPTEVKSLNQNCIYPGRGPIEQNIPCEQDGDGNILGGTCVPTTYNSLNVYVKKKVQ